MEVPLTPFTFNIDYKKLNTDAHSPLMIALAMSVNDLANTSLLVRLSGDYVEQNELQNTFFGAEETALGFRLHALRMQVGHLCEGVMLVDKIGKSEDYWKVYLDRMTPNEREAYDYFRRCWLKGSEEEKTFMDKVKDIRHKVGFHYDMELIGKALNAMAEQNDLTSSKLILADDVHNTRFVIADGVIMTAIGKELWGIDIFAPGRTSELSKMIEWVGTQSKMFYKFGRGLCVHYFQDFHGE